MTAVERRRKRDREYMRRWRKTPAGKAWEKRNTAQKNARRRADPSIGRAEKLKRRYGLTLEQYDAMLEEQNGVCAVCAIPSAKPLHVDHCHATGEVRGLLCFCCNSALGHMAEDPERMAKLADYARRHTVVAR